MTGAGIKYGTPPNNIDILTAKEAIQLKTGRELPSINQANATIKFATEQSLKPVLVYNPNLVTSRAIDAFKKAYPQYEVRVATDIPKNRHEVMMKLSDIIKF